MTNKAWDEPSRAERVRNIAAYFANKALAESPPEYLNALALAAAAIIDGFYHPGLGRQRARYQFINEFRDHALRHDTDS